MLLIDSVGRLVTVTDTEAVAVPQAFDTVTVLTPDVFTEIVLVVAPVLQLKDEMLELAVKVPLCPLHNDKLVGLTVTVGIGVTTRLYVSEAEPQLLVVVTTPLVEVLAVKLTEAVVAPAGLLQL